MSEKVVLVIEVSADSDTAADMREKLAEVQADAAEHNAKVYLLEGRDANRVIRAAKGAL